jgi:hypothetical protein
MEWTIERVTEQLRQIKEKGFIAIPLETFRKDDGVVGQVLEREFHVEENNLKVRDLGTFELKGIRKRSTLITLSHKSPEKGLRPLQIFDRFGYLRKSKSKPDISKKNLFVTVSGKKPNSLGLRLRGIGSSSLDMVYCENGKPDEFICEWDLTKPLEKIDQIILVRADTRGEFKKETEEFHYTEAYLLNGLKGLKDLVDTNIIVIDFCIDQKFDASGASLGSPHDRGAHIRVPMKKIRDAYNEVIKIL